MNSTLSVSLAFTNLHIGNGGLNIAVLDGSEGPTLQFIFSTFGHASTTTVYTSVDGLREVGEMLLSTVNSDHEWQKEYGHHARLTHSRRYGQDEVSFVKTVEGSKDEEDAPPPIEPDEKIKDSPPIEPNGKIPKKTFEDFEGQATKAIETACTLLGIPYVEGTPNGREKEVEGLARALMDMSPESMSRLTQHLKPTGTQPEEPLSPG